jgi:hypothetical protein
MATKEAYQKKLQAQLKEWDAKLDLLSAKAQKVAADARINYEDELVALRSKRAEAHRVLAELGTRGENAWEDMKDGVDTAWDAMSQALERVAARFK